MSPPITLTVGGRDLTAGVGGSTFSNVDPGGHEAAALAPDRLGDIKPGDRVTARCGLDTMWDGYVNEPGQSDRGGRSDASIGCLGYGALFKSPDFRQIFVGRDLTAGWSPAPSLERRRTLLSAGYVPNDASIDSDATTGRPALSLKAQAPWPTTKPVSEAMYDTQGIAIGSIYYAWLTGPSFDTTNTHWSYSVGLALDDTYSSFDGSANLRSSGVTSGSGTLTASTGTRMFAFVQLLYDNPGITTDLLYDLSWTCLAVYGNHGLAKRGVATATEPQGFYPGDIVGYVNNLGFPLVADDSSSVIVRQSAYLAPVPREQPIQDMATLMGWHWGVWEPATIMDTIPRLFFQAPPTTATCTVRRSECDELQEPVIRFDKLVENVIVGYRDQADTQRYVTVSAPNPLARAAGFAGYGSVTVDFGTGSLAAATAYGQVVLALLQSSGRGSGSALLPDTVALPGGGRKPACLLKAGRDRIRIQDLPTIGSILETDTRRFDTFLIRRVSTTIDADGTPRTRVEFDTGADLLEVFAARLANGVFGVI